MNATVMGLLYIEKEAQRAGERAESERAGLSARIEDARAEITNRVNAENEKKITEFGYKIKREYELQVQAIRENTDKQLKEINKLYETEKKAWEDEIVNQVLKYSGTD